MEFYSIHQLTQQSNSQGFNVPNTTCIKDSDKNNTNTISTVFPTASADAAAVAAAKDMLQLHHGTVVCSNSNSLTTLETSTSKKTSMNPPDNSLGCLRFEQETLYITESCTIIGRNSSTSHVHFHVAENNLVSRKHFQILFDCDTQDFYVQCLSKNGIFVDDFLQRRHADPLKLTESCFFRFPSTEIRIQFESFLTNSTGINPAYNVEANSPIKLSETHAVVIHNNNENANSGNTHVIISPVPPDDHRQQSNSHHQNINTIGSSTTASSHLLSVDNTSGIYSPLKITIPKKEQKSPYMSPTGTISAANSCPASPRQNFHQTQSNYISYTSSTIQNQDLFQTPSTASYNHNEKPPYSYAQLIVQAISAAPDKQLTLSGIYSFIVKHYPYYRKETNKGWQNSIRHNLSLNRYFIKVARSQDEPGKGSFWRIDPDSGAKLIDHSYKKRRQRSSQGFRPSYGMPRSAPVSPSHMDNSRESSPLQDIVLQSAPGSPGLAIESRPTDTDTMYNAQNAPQSANNLHNQYNSRTPYFVSNQNSTNNTPGSQRHQALSDNGSGAGNGVSALIALKKRNHATSATGVISTGHQLQQRQHQHTLHSEMYEDVPTDYSGNLESDDEREATKRPKYMSEVL